LAGLTFGCYGHTSASAQHDHSHGAKPAEAIADAASRDEMNHGDMNRGDMNHGDMKHSGMESGGHSHGADRAHGTGHSHGAMEVSSDIPIPAVELLITEDAVRGWNVHTKLTNFSYAPETVNETSLQTEGHAHLYVNGEKLTRLYSSWYYLSELPSGANELKVTLNANDHQDLTLNGEVIGDVVTIEVP
ncbi:MAG: hypothetical protein AAFX40_19055, partial [Cyanobacteria bacterium J06639_1]